MTDHSVSCPAARRTKNHRTTMSKTWQTVQWKANVASFIADKSCEWCGSDKDLLAHHPYQNVKDGAYSDLYLSGCIVLCNKCHFMYHRRHKRICQVCKVGWRHLDTEMCYECHLKAHPGLVEEIAARKEKREEEDRQYRNARNAKNRAAKRKHPCRWHRIRGVCGKSMINSQCPFAPTKAQKGCHGGFEMKKGVRV